MRSILDIVDLVINNTKEKKLSWDKKNSHIFTCKISPAYEISIWHWTDQDSNVSGYTAQLDYKNNMIDQIMINEYAGNYGKIQELLEIARRSANNVDKAIDEIEEILKSLPDGKRLGPAR